MKEEKLLRLNLILNENNSASCVFRALKRVKKVNGSV